MPSSGADRRRVVGSVAPWNAARRKTAVSMPSRRTAKKAMPTSAIAEPLRQRVRGAGVAARTSGRRAWRRIQTIMKVTIPTASEGDDGLQHLLLALRQLLVEDCRGRRRSATQIATAIATPDPHLPQRVAATLLARGRRR